MAFTTIKIKTGTTKPTTSDVVAGELAYDTTGNDLYVGTTGNVGDLVTSARQVEINGPQTIEGTKTIDLQNLILPGTNAGPGQVLTGSNTGGAVSWQPAASLIIGADTCDPTMDGEANEVDAFNNNPTNNVVATGELFIWTWPSADGTAYIFTDTAPQGSMTSLGSATSFATQSQVRDRSADNVAIAPDTYGVDQGETVGDVSTLNAAFTGTTAVEAINENYAAIAAIAGNPVFISGLGFNAPIPDGDYTGGQYFIVDTGPGIRTVYPDSGGEDVNPGDWIICETSGTMTGGNPGTASFVRLGYAMSNQTATLTEFTPTGNITGTNVQVACTELDGFITANGVLITNNGDAITVNANAITGIIGNTSGPLGSTVAYINGGSY